MEQDNSSTETTFAFTSQEAYYSCSDTTIGHPVQHLDRSERPKLAIDDLRIGQRIHEELKRQGRTVAWLARQLGVERTGLYYTFRQNSIDMELLYRVSVVLDHNFFQDVSELYKSSRL